ncbi:MAG: hypothetical protein LAN71_18050 [Acidobacteriia bacterium]|nr:hypothetical protein [Terriglobia bacterium]
MMKVSKQERFYLIKFSGEIIRFRNILRKKNKELEPLIQMETKVGSKWLPVLRCDRSHDFLHIDLYYKNGEKKKKDLESKDAVSAIVEVIDLLKREWRELFLELQYDEISNYFASNQESIKSELDNASKYLLNEAKQPDAIRDSKGKGIITFSADAYIEKK